MPDPYIVQSAADVVEMWSAVRLPFEPHGWQVNMRNELREALQDLRTSSGWLHAVYRAAADGALVDTENVLLYNVGGTALRPLMARAVTFERSYQVPPQPPGPVLGDGQTLHYHRYSEARDTSFEFWKPGRLLGSFFDVPVDSVDDKPAPVWKAIRDYAAPPAETATAPTRFVINVQITDTRESRPADSVVSIIKPGLDGIISAYHSHEGSDGVAEARRLEEAGLGTAETLQKQLLDPRWAALGPRRLVRPFGETGVQWNPADDYCVAAHVSLTTDKASADNHQARWRLTAELMEATLLVE